MDRFFSCNICLEKFDLSNELKVPKTLKCGHAQFCKQCLVNIAQANDNVIACPICKKEQKITNFDDDVPNNVTLVNILKKMVKPKEEEKLEDDKQDEEHRRILLETTKISQAG